MNRRPTIIDVAREAGVSKSTVSLVLQDSPLVKGETRARVQETMVALGYVYNRAAANLRTANVGLIGLVINDLRNPFFTEFATSAQMAFSEQGYATVIANTNENPTLQAQVVGSMIEHGVSAIVISPTYGSEEFTFGPLVKARIPALQVLRQVDARTELFPFSSFDYPTGSAQAARHLIDQGASKIAFIGGLEERPITQERLSGYLDVMRLSGLEPLILHGRPTREFGAQTAQRLTAEFPQFDAAICYNDLIALGMMSGFLRTGRKVGMDFKLVGFDDIEECAQVWPQLSSVRCDISNFGRQTAMTVLEWLERGIQPVGESRSPVNLVVRASSV
jgi:LacI family transcriptional regulator